MDKIFEEMVQDAGWDILVIYTDKEGNEFAQTFIEKREAVQFFHSLDVNKYPRQALLKVCRLYVEEEDEE